MCECRMSNQKERSAVYEKLITKDILAVLLKDRTTGGNIIWATEDYVLCGIGYSADSQILVDWLVGNDRKNIIKPRVQKTREDQAQRSKDKAEVFTPAWVCNKQNNLVDRAWFGARGGCFNVEKGTYWETDYKKIFFPDKPGKTWIDYVKAKRMEITCGEAPYITSRYDMLTGKWIPVKNRIGLLDRKLRIVSENTETSAEWIRYAKEAVKSIYGFDWQGDNVFLARQNVLYAVIEAYYEKYKKVLNPNTVLILAEIISWNIWQMDGIKFVIPNTCHDTQGQMNLLGEMKKDPCPGCANNNKWLHNGTYSIIMDWDKKSPIRFVDTLEGGKEHG